MFLQLPNEWKAEKHSFFVFFEAFFTHMRRKNAANRTLHEILQRFKGSVKRTGKGAAMSLVPVAQSVENGEASTRVSGSNPGGTLSEIFLSLLALLCQSSIAHFEAGGVAQDRREKTL